MAVRRLMRGKERPISAPRSRRGRASKPSLSTATEVLPPVASAETTATNGRSHTERGPDEQRAEPGTAWRRVDLHLHTPASLDYQDPNVTALDILRRAEERGLDIIAFTDHNSVRGYADLWREIEDLELLEYLKRLQPDEEARLREYRRLLDSVLLLPGFEFTATFGFHILAIFPEGTSVRLLEHLLLLLGVPEDRFGSGEVGATSDVLRAYEVLDAHGALVIGAHVNSTHGIAMQGLRFGGQTKIAYTQDEHLHALEVTDLAIGGHRRSTARFFSGTKPEYARRMHCIQGSDAHRLDRDARRDASLGVGDRATEILLPELSFAALKRVFLEDDFSLTRPYQPRSEPAEKLRAARADGNTESQAFHENLRTKRTGMAHVVRDIVALANTSGGTVYVGASPFEKRAIAGIGDADPAGEQLAAEVASRVTPALTVTTDVIDVDGKSVLAVQVPEGVDRPYALDPGGIVVRDEGESRAAQRDEIVALVQSTARGAGQVGQAASSRGQVVPRQSPAARAETGRDGASVVGAGEPSAAVTAEPEAAPVKRRGRRGGRSRGGVAAAVEQPATDQAPVVAAERLEEYAEDAPPDDVAPTTGFEILYSFEQDGIVYHTLRDLRNQKLIHNVNRETERRLWRLAITERETQELDESGVRWQGDYGFWRSFKPRGGERRYHLLYRGDGDIRVFYGVSEDGMDERWRAVLPTTKTSR